MNTTEDYKREFARLQSGELDEIVVETRNKGRKYVFAHDPEKGLTMKGHPVLCPEPIPVTLHTLYFGYPMTVVVESPKPYIITSAVESIGFFKYPRCENGDCKDHYGDSAAWCFNCKR